MDVNALLLLAAGVAAPALTALLKQPVWSTRVNWVASVLTSVGLGTAAQAVGDGISAEELASTATLVWVVGQALYHLVFKHTGLNAFLERVAVWRPVKGDQ